MAWNTSKNTTKSLNQFEVLSRGYVKRRKRVACVARYQNFLHPTSRRMKDEKERKGVSGQNGKMERDKLFESKEKREESPG